MGNGSNIVDVKQHNRQLLLQCLLDAPLSRAGLARQMGVSSMTVTNLVRTLIAEGWVEPLSTSAETQPRTVGRPRTQLQINRHAAHAVGIHIGIGSYRVALVDLLGTPVQIQEGQFALEQSAETTLTQFSHTVTQLLAQHETPILGIGVGASGLVDSDQGLNVIAPSLNWRNVPIGSLLKERLGLPVFVENNVRAMALAEAYFGQGKDVDSLAFVFGRIGVGAGFIMRRKLLRGIAAGAGEIGHTIILPENGARCRCGQTGCLETLVTEPILLGDDDLTLDQLFNEARRGNKIYLGRIHQLCVYLGIALTNLVNTLNPERIVLGGLYAQGADLLLPRLREIVRERAFGRLGHQVTIDTTTFDKNAGIIGAATLALVHNFYDRPLRQVPQG